MSLAFFACSAVWATGTIIAWPGTPEAGCHSHIGAFGAGMASAATRCASPVALRIARLDELRSWFKVGAVAGHMIKVAAINMIGTMKTPALRIELLRER